MSNLHVLVYLSADHQYSKDIDAGILNQVSSGTTPKTLNCSACGYNFIANSETRRFMWKGLDYTPLCPDGHQWGTNGNHLKLGEMSEWRELSVVSRGAAPNARVLKSSEARLALETTQINLSHSLDNDTLLLSTELGAEFMTYTPEKTPTPTNNTGEFKNMSEINLSQEDYKKLVGDQALLAKAQADLAAANTAQTKAEADLAAAVTAKDAAEKAQVDLQADLDKVNAELTAANTKIQVLQGGTNPNGEGTGTGAENNSGQGDGGEGANLSAGNTLLDPSFFKTR